MYDSVMVTVLYCTSPVICLNVPRIVPSVHSSGLIRRVEEVGGEEERRSMRRVGQQFLPTVGHLQYTIQYCTVLYCTVLYSVVLYCTVL